MPENQHSTFDLLRDIDVSLLRKDDKQLDALLMNIQKSRVSETKSATLKTTHVFADRLRITKKLEQLNKPKIEDLPPAENPEYEVLKTEKLQLNRSLLQSFTNINEIFTVPEKTVGPFTTIDGLEVIYNFYRTVNDFKIFFPNEAEAAFIIPARIQRLLLNQQISTLTLTKGNVWIRADLFDPAAPKTQYVGLKISNGNINLFNKFSVTNNSITVPKGISLDIDFDLDNSFTAKQTDAIGIDGYLSVFTPTVDLKLKYSHSRIIATTTDAFYGKTFGWESRFLRKEQLFKWNEENSQVLLELKSGLDDFKVESCKSEFFTLKGNAKVRSAFWALPTRKNTNNQAVEVAFNGALQLFLLEGLSINWQGIHKLENEVLCNRCQLLFLNGTIAFQSKTADFQLINEHFTLWQKSLEKPEKMELKIQFRDYQNLQFMVSSDEMETVITNCDTDFKIDKPLYAENIPVQPYTKKSGYGKGISKTGMHFILTDADLLTEDQTGEILSFVPMNEQHKTFVLENAYLITSSEATLFLNAKSDQNNHLYEGRLQMSFLIYDLVPTLLHPYTGNRFPQIKRGRIYESAQQNSDILLADIVWETTENFTESEVTFKMKQRKLLPRNKEYPQTEFENRNKQIHPDQKRKMQEAFMLLDVSTQADHWGISLSYANLDRLNKTYHDTISIESENVVTINRNYLEAPIGLLHGITLPQVSWEPVFNLTPPTSAVNEDPNLGILPSINNNIPTVFSQLDNRRIKIGPSQFIRNFKVNLNPKEGEVSTSNPQNLNSTVLFSLPNGKFGIVSLSPFNQTEERLADNHLDFIDPNFEQENLSLKGSLQFRIAAKKTSDEAPPQLDGVAKQLKTLLNNTSVLGKTVTEIFNTNFFNDNLQNADYYYAGNLNKNVPLEMIDFSGYGASMFSNWRNPMAKFAAIAQTKFDVMRGRLAQEIVEAVSMIYPWGICTSRTVTFLRNNNAIIYREDSGWISQSEGTFDFSFTAFEYPSLSKKDFNNPYRIYPGLVEGLHNIRNIREDYRDVPEFTYQIQNGEYYLDESTAPDSVRTDINGQNVQAKFVAVYFDADVKIDGIDNFVTGKQFKGYLQIKPMGVPIPARIMDQLIRRSQNSVGGSVDTTFNIEKTNQKFKANRIEVSASYENENQYEFNLVASVKGAVQLPAEGSWSVVEVDQKNGDVSNIAAGTSVGLIKDGMRPLGAGIFTNSNTVSKLAFPDSLKNKSEQDFGKTYGILQNTETQKLLLKTLEYKKGLVDKFISDPALLADSFRLMNSKGPFPNLVDAIQLDQGELINNVSKTVMGLLNGGIEKVFPTLKVPDNFSFNIVGKENDAFRIYIKYDSSKMDGSDKKESLIDYATNSVGLGNWSNKMHNLTVAVDLLCFKPLMYISGDFNVGKSASAEIKTGDHPQLKLHDTLQKIYDILEFLRNLDPSNPSEAIKKGLKVVMSNSSDSWEYKFKADKEIPLVKFPFDPVNYNSPTTPLKLDAFFKIGVYFNQPIKIPNTIDQLKPSVGTYLQLGADLRVMCVSLAAATIYATGRAEVGLSADLNNPPTLYFKFGFGVELAVGLPVIGSVAVLYMVGVDMKINSEILVVGAFIYFRGRVEIFGGIVTITIAIEAAGKIEKSFIGGPTNCIAMCTFALDISIAFVININFTETWQEKRQIS